MKKSSFFIVLIIFSVLYSCIPSLHSIVTDKNRITDDRIIGTWKQKVDGTANMKATSFKVTSFSVQSDDPADQEEGELLMQQFIDSLENTAEYDIWKFERASKLTFKYKKLPEGIIDWSTETIGGAETTLARLRAQYKNNDIVIAHQEELPFYVLYYTNPDFPDHKIKMKISLTKIGKHLYMDMYPMNNTSQISRFEANVIDAHTFAKVEFKNDKLLIHSFDVDRIESLLKSKRARLKHEVITQAKQEKNKIIYEDNIVLTASTDELRAFILKYGDNEELFDLTDELIAGNE